MAGRVLGMMGCLLTELEELGIPRQPGRKGVKRQGERRGPLSGVTEPVGIPRRIGKIWSVSNAAVHCAREP